MDPTKEHNVIVKGSESIAKFINNKKFDITDLTNLGDGVELISYKDYMDDELEGKHCFDNICVAIASSITAYSIISMSKIKMEYINNLYYSDTDSLDLDVQLDNKYISDKLGDFKFENVFIIILKEASTSNYSSTVDIIYVNSLWQKNRMALYFSYIAGVANS